MSYLVLARKWRPQKFEELFGQEPICRVLKNAILLNKIAHAYIFSGPRGVGKTSAARILAKSLNCKNASDSEPCCKCPSCESISSGSSLDVSEIDGASNNSVDDIRDLREKIRYASSSQRYKVYIIDEAQMLSTSAFNALLKTLEEPPPFVIFVLATTDPKKIPATVLSRCQHLPFRKISSAKIKERLKFICNEESISIEESALDTISRVSEGSMRDALTILDQIISFSDNITSNDIKDLFGFTETKTLYDITTSIIDGNNKDIIKIISEVTATGTDLKILTKELVQFIRNLLIAKITEDFKNILDIPAEECILLDKLKIKTSEEHLSLVLLELIKAEQYIRSSLFPRVTLEITLIKLSLFNHYKSINEALKLLDKPMSYSQTQKPLQKETTQDIHPQTITEIWNDSLNLIEKNNIALFLKLKETKISHQDNTIKIILQHRASIHLDAIKENLPLIKETVLKVANRNIDVIIETEKVIQTDKNDIKKKILNNPIIKEAMELFDAKIVDIKPIKKNEGYQ